ncbi:unnamed protein product [[Actinomadura] parvosata subsp. kistnae]|uniref:Uncharacterized protein n=1 Tax=[Actinomadura] parvosata subsp. kistnae TaxID=1909395 RepID=A0A1U9ZZ96_9ACTN|nr:hypothetical protein [Nonomuraea sp. ATCC 55076]AQZ63257.1 hypothetical protein BKM31_18915 [Nonomuraea sp. ATCC 55076]SPL98938.1 unnamed protein product [Actinomadura parvosata subsp. kistnae]
MAIPLGTRTRAHGGGTRLPQAAATPPGPSVSPAAAGRSAAGTPLPRWAYHAGHLTTALLVTIATALVVAFRVRQQTVNAIILGTFLPLTFVSDVFVIGGELPAALRTIGDVFPLKHVSHTVLAVLDPAGRPWPWTDLAVVTAWTLAGLAALAVVNARRRAA